MKFSQAIAKLGQRLTYRRAWRRARRIIFPVRIAPLLAKIDQGRLQTLRAEHGSLPSSAPALWRHYSKYLDVEKRLRINIRRAQDLNLHRLPPQEILDIGCGGGFFLFVAQALGSVLRWSWESSVESIVVGAPSNNARAAVVFG